MNNEVEKVVVEDIEDRDDADVIDDPIAHGIEAFGQRSLAAKRAARAMERASRDWPLVKSDEDWENVVTSAATAYDNGAFLLAQMGGEAAIDPEMTATLLILRQRLMDEMPADAAHETMLIDCAILAYFNTLRVQRWSNDLAFHTERELFGLDAPSMRYRYGKELADHLTVEEHFTRLREQCLPMLDRSNRLLIRNLGAIKELRQAHAPVVSVGIASQVNVQAIEPQRRRRPARRQASTSE
jgi:hypothetical protein